MSRYSRMEVLNQMYDGGLVVVFYNPDLSVTQKVAEAVLEGGCRLLEFTNRGDHAYQVFSELEQYCAKNLPELILGVGSIADPYTASLYISGGANYVVGPMLNQEVAKLCNRRKIAYSPGCGSVSEIAQAEELGCEIAKVFPGGQVGGPAFVKAVKGPCPWTSIMPTGGVSPTEDSLSQWFDAGVACVGIGSKLVTKDLLQAGDYTAISKNIQDTLKIIKKVRGK